MISEGRIRSETNNHSSLNYEFELFLTKYHLRILYSAQKGIR